MVCNDFLTGSSKRRQVERRYKIGNSRLTYWLKEYGYSIKPEPQLVFLPTMSDSSKSNLSQKEIDKLKRELEDAKLLAEAYRKMIETAENELKISIRKKSNTK
tara:strand:+ start:129 stop:437 length:309 start_codon:yes stop_codon:yes gene_type:complete